MAKIAFRPRFRAFRRENEKTWEICAKNSDAIIFLEEKCNERKV